MNTDFCPRVMVSRSLIYEPTRPKLTQHIFGRKRGDPKQCKTAHEVLGRKSWAVHVAPSSLPIPNFSPRFLPFFSCLHPCRFSRSPVLALLSSPPAISLIFPHTPLLPPDMICEATCTASHSRWEIEAPLARSCLRGSPWSPMLFVMPQRS